MTKEPNNTAIIKRPRAFAWVALLALAIFQLASAGHDSQHTIGDISDTCVMCAQLDDSGSAIAPSQAQDVAIQQAATTGHLASQVNDNRPAGARHSRAPPVS